MLSLSESFSTYLEDLFSNVASSTVSVTHVMIIKADTNIWSFLISDKTESQVLTSMKTRRSSVGYGTIAITVMCLLLAQKLSQKIIKVSENLTKSRCYKNK